jgi:hypothetical protein
MEDRYFEIGRHELHSKDFVWSCILRFREITSYGIWGDNLVLMWSKDYKKLIANQKDSK